MSLVKWVSPNNLYDMKDGNLREVSVLHLADLTKLVERVRDEWGESSMLDGYVKDLLTQLQAHTKEAE